MILLTTLLGVLLLATWVAYGDATTKEAVERRAALRLSSMDKAMTDMDGRCWVCTAEANPLELVDTGRRFELACGPCAALTHALARSRVA